MTSERVYDQQHHDLLKDDGCPFKDFPAIRNLDVELCPWFKQISQFAISLGLLDSDTRFHD